MKETLSEPDRILAKSPTLFSFFSRPVTILLIESKLIAIGIFSRRFFHGNVPKDLSWVLRAYLA